MCVFCREDEVSQDEKEVQSADITLVNDDEPVPQLDKELPQLVNINRFGENRTHAKTR